MSTFMVIYEINYPINKILDEDITELEKELIKYFDPPANCQKPISKGYLKEYSTLLCKELEKYIANKIEY
jgi:hypothetical protein